MVVFIGSNNLMLLDFTICKIVCIIYYMKSWEKIQKGPHIMVLKVADGLLDSTTV